MRSKKWLACPMTHQKSLFFEYNVCLTIHIGSTRLLTFLSYNISMSYQFFEIVPISLKSTRKTKICHVYLSCFVV